MLAIVRRVLLFHCVCIGMPDLVPDLEAFSRSLFYVYLYGIPLDYLTCALEENCLSSSAYGKPFDHRRYIQTMFLILIVSNSPTIN